MMWDAAIIGTGPAGLSAALNLKLHEKNFIWFGSPSFSHKVERSEKIANYPGFSMITGQELNTAFARQVREMGLTVTDKMVTSIVAARSYYMLMAENEIYEAKTILLATGMAMSKTFPGEQKLLGHGVSYCATCDGFLYKDKTIGIFCENPRFEHEVSYLAEMAKKVYLYVPYTDCNVDCPNVIRLQDPIVGILGEKHVSGMALKDGSKVLADGVFILRSAVAAAALLPKLEMDGVHICIDREMNTNLAGCFAAGDCTGRPYQITKAVGEGNIAAHSMIKYLSEG